MRDFNSNGLIDKNEIFDWFIAAEKIRKSSQFIVSVQPILVVKLSGDGLSRTWTVDRLAISNCYDS